MDRNGDLWNYTESIYIVRSVSHLLCLIYSIVFECVQFLCDFCVVYWLDDFLNTLVREASVSAKVCIITHTGVLSISLRELKLHCDREYDIQVLFDYYATFDSLYLSAFISLPLDMFLRVGQISLSSHLSLCPLRTQLSIACMGVSGITSDHQCERLVCLAAQLVYCSSSRSSLQGTLRIIFASGICLFALRPLNFR